MTIRTETIKATTVRTGGLKTTFEDFEYNEKLIGKKACVKKGFFAFRFGIIEKNNFITPYVIRFEDGTVTGFHKESDIIRMKKVNK